jgi:hypothetical protein
MAVHNGIRHAAITIQAIFDVDVAVSLSIVLFPVLSFTPSIILILGSSNYSTDFTDCWNNGIMGLSQTIRKERRRVELIWAGLRRKLGRIQISGKALFKGLVVDQRDCVVRRLDNWPMLGPWRISMPGLM